MTPVADDVAAFLGRPGDQALLALATTHLGVRNHMVRAYARGKGFDGGEPVDASAQSSSPRAPAS